MIIFIKIGGWYFGDYPGSTPLSEIPDGYKSLKEVYLATDPNYEGRVSVPVLYDKKVLFRFVVLSVSVFPFN